MTEIALRVFYSSCTNATETSLKVRVLLVCKCDRNHATGTVLIVRKRDKNHAKGVLHSCKRDRIHAEGV